jgi:uncharacterized YigZ family protein
MSYAIPAGLATAEIEIKKSRFIAFAQHIVSRETGLEWLQQLKQTYPDARHHCWAYQLGNPACATNAGMGDDGEPSGTAGKPILNVLQHKNVGDVMIVVVRYFGGVKLGAGGLTRAYGQAAQAVMEVLPIQQQIDLTDCEVLADFSQEQAIRHQLSLLEGTIQQVQYGAQVQMLIALPTEQLDTFKTFLAAHNCPLRQT